MSPVGEAIHFLPTDLFRLADDFASTFRAVGRLIGDLFGCSAGT